MAATSNQNSHYCNACKTTLPKGTALNRKVDATNKRGKAITVTALDMPCPECGDLADVDAGFPQYADPTFSMTDNCPDVLSLAAWLATFRWVVVSSSAGKDSQAMLDYIAELVAAGLIAHDRVVVVHCDLGRAEWQGTRALAFEQAKHYGFRFEVVTRPQGDLLTHIEERGMWPGAATRFCTSEHKRAQALKVFTALGKESGKVNGQAPRVLNCMGFRAQESSARAARPVVSVNEKGTGQGNAKEVIDWLPIHAWSEDEVWARIAKSGVAHHPAYDLGMPRLSCVFCIFAPKDALLIAGHANPELLKTYAALEVKIGHQFRGNPAKPTKGDVSMVALLAEVEAGVQGDAKAIVWGNQ